MAKQQSDQQELRNHSMSMMPTTETGKVVANSTSMEVENDDGASYGPIFEQTKRKDEMRSDRADTPEQTKKPKDASFHTPPRLRATTEQQKQSYLGAAIQQAKRSPVRPEKGGPS